MLRHLVRILFSLSVFAALFFIPDACSYATAGLRWAQVDKGVVSYAYRAGAMLIQQDRISSISQTYGALMFDGTKWNSTTSRDDKAAWSTKWLESST